MTLALIVFCSMFTQDSAAALKIRCLNGVRRRPWLAGLFEAVNDVGAALSIGIGGASVYRFGVSARSFEILAALALAAILGTKAGDLLSTRIVP